MDAMEQKPSDQEPRPSVAGSLWLLALATGTTIGVGFGAAMGSIGAGRRMGVGVVLPLD